ncbi:hypothetical protein K2173_024922 [Erythroxylum novogranatense]|uniref:Uncharacterized protein n=1 Tax=Erythroxylum novogranatense TaxID=1862640 RepID=A0AAV8UG42_9ROSI|nr:hypothetical protein K2173_024922 [Erythroxylum novogranatense]
MTGEFHEGSPSSKSQDDALLAIQNLTLEIRTNRQEHLVLSQRVDQVYSILEAKAFLNPQNKGVLGNHPFGPRRNPQSETADDNVDTDTTPAGRAPNIRIDAPKFNGTDPSGWVYKTIDLARELATNYTNTMSSLAAGGHRPWQTTTTRSVGTNMGTPQLRNPSVNVTQTSARQATAFGISTLPIRKLSLAE